MNPNTSTLSLIFGFRISLRAKYRIVKELTNMPMSLVLRNVKTVNGTMVAAAKTRTKRCLESILLNQIQS